MKSRNIIKIVKVKRQIKRSKSVTRSCKKNRRKLTIQSCRFTRSLLIWAAAGMVADAGVGTAQKAGLNN